MTPPPATNATTPAQQAEADRAQDVYLWALNYVGAGVIAQASQDWQNSVTQGLNVNKTAVLKKVGAMIGLRRSWLLGLAKTHYRLTRALRTGSTVDIPGLPSQNVSVESLRQEFETVVNEIAVHGGAAPKAVGVRPTFPPVTEADKKPIKVEKLSGDINKVISQMADDATEQLNTTLASVGVDRLQKKLAKIDTSKPADEVDKERAQEALTSGNRQAAEAERIALLAARDMTYNLGQMDDRLIGWVRYSKTGTPCGFCAMLLTRGFTSRSGLYKSKTTATVNEEAQQYHANCHCVAVPIFSKEQLDSPLFDLNRKYAKEWPEVTQGLGGEDALTAWRKHVRQQKSTTSKPAQEAA